MALIITEGTAISHESSHGYPQTPVIHTNPVIARWKEVTEKVKIHGCKILNQLWHVGSYRRPDFDPENKIPSFGPSAIPHPGLKNQGLHHTPKEMSLDDIEKIIKAYEVSAANAHKAGFDGVEIHGAHGYLLDQFFWEETNKRRDTFGGPLKNRVKLAEEIVKSIRSVVPSDFLIGFRFSQWKLGDFDAKPFSTPQELEKLLVPLSNAGVDLFHASTYRLCTPEFIDSPLTLGGWTKKITGRPTMAVGGVGLSTDFAQEKQGAIPSKKIDLNPLIEKIENNEFDFIAIGRALLGDPYWVLKLHQGQLNDIRSYKKEDLNRLY